MKKSHILLLSLMPSMALADWGMMDRGYSHMTGYGSGGMFFGMGFMFLILIGIVFLAVNQFRPSHKTHQQTDSAIEIVRVRFAKGEITEAEMEQLLQKLK